MFQNSCQKPDAKIELFFHSTKKKINPYNFFDDVKFYLAPLLLAGCVLRVAGCVLRAFAFMLAKDDFPEAY